jgi:hypothetical protein
VGAGRLEQVPDAACEVAFEAADRFAVGLGFGVFAGDVGPGLGWQRAGVTAMRWIAVLIWRLPPRSRRWRLVLPELTGIGAMPPARASLGVGGEALGAGDLADQLAGGQRPEAGLGEQLRRDLGGEAGDLCLERVDRA